MAENFLGGLAVAAISALFYLAYRHPSSFRLVRPSLIGICLAGFIGTWIWNYAIQMASFQTPSEMDFSQKIAIRDEIQSLAVSPLGLSIFALAAAITFVILSWVATLNDEDKDEGEN